MKKIINLVVACMLAVLANAQQLPKGKLIKDIRTGSRGSSPTSFLSFDNSIFVSNSFDLKYYKINEQLNGVELAPILDSSGEGI